MLIEMSQSSCEYLVPFFLYHSALTATYIPRTNRIQRPDYTKRSVSIRRWITSSNLFLRRLRSASVVRKRKSVPSKRLPPLSTADTRPNISINFPFSFVVPPRHTYLQKRPQTEAQSSFTPQGPPRPWMNSNLNTPTTPYPH